MLLHWLAGGNSCGPGPLLSMFSSISSSMNTGTLAAALPVFQGCYWRTGERKLGSNYNWSCCPNVSPYFKIWAHSPCTNTSSWILLVLRTENNLSGWSIDPIGLSLALSEEGQAMSGWAFRSSGAQGTCAAATGAAHISREECYQAFSERRTCQNTYWHDKPQWIWVFKVKNTLLKIST